MLSLSRLISVLLYFKIPFQLSNLLASFIQPLLLLLDELIIFVLLFKILYDLFLFDRFFDNFLYWLFRRLFFLLNRLLFLLSRLLLLLGRLLLLLIRFFLVFNFCLLFFDRLDFFLSWFFLDLFLLLNRILFYDICFGLLRIRADLLFLGLSSFFCLCSIHRDLFYLRLFPRYNKLIWLCLLRFYWRWRPLIFISDIIITLCFFRCSLGTLMC